MVMFWNKFTFWQTVKFKLAFHYTFLFGMSFLACFTAIYFYQLDHIYDDIDDKLKIFQNAFEYEYLTGKEFDNRSRRIKLKDVPHSLLTKIKKQYKGFKPLLALSDHKNVISVLGDNNGVATAFSSADSYPYLIKRTFNVDRISILSHKYNNESFIKNLDMFLLCIMNEKRKVLVRSYFSSEYIPEVSKEEFSAMKKKDQWDTLWFRQHQMRVLKHRLFDGNILIIAYNMEDLKSSHARLLFVFIVSLCCMLGAGILSASLLAKKFVRGIDRITRATRQIGAGDFTRRVEHGREGLEMDKLIDAFNDMAENTDKLLRELRTISDDIAHDLRTPITRMCGKAEMAMISGKHDELASDVAEECSQMLIMINTMLEITHSEFKIDKNLLEDLDLCVIGGNIGELFSTIAEDKGINLNVEIQKSPIMFKGQKVKLQQLCANLLDNAFKFTQPGGTVSFSLKKHKHHIYLTVRDTGCGISESDQKRVFDRFFRADISRSLPGNGLGLSLVHAIVIAHGGTIHLNSNEGSGSEFIITFPCLTVSKL